MVPPSLAFAGVLLNNQTLVNIAHEQCQLYRQAMRNESAGLWAHILLGTGIEDMGGEISDLQNWVTEIMSTSQNHLVSWSRWLCWNALIVDR
jgi:hypothetical protein